MANGAFWLPESTFFEHEGNRSRSEGNSITYNGFGKGCFFVFHTKAHTIHSYSLGCPHFPVIVANEGLGWDLLIKMVHNPGGDWKTGEGNNPTFFSLHS